MLFYNQWFIFSCYCIAVYCVCVLQDLKTPLHYACYWGNPDLVTPLLDRNHGKAFVDAQDRNGDTALHIASRHGHRKVIKELQRRKANQHLQNHVSFVGKSWLLTITVIEVHVPRG